MFILRRVTSEGNVSNTIIGKQYSVVCPVPNPTEFEKAMELEEFYKRERENIFGFIIYDGGSEIEPLYKKSHYYVMTESGKTFEKLQ